MNAKRHCRDRGRFSGKHGHGHSSLGCGFLIAMWIVLALWGCTTVSPPVVAQPDSLTPDLVQTDEQAGKVRDLAQGTPEPLPSETDILKGMTEGNLKKSGVVDTQTAALMKAAKHYQAELDERKKELAKQAEKAAALKRMMLYLKIGSLAILTVLAGIIAVKTTGSLRTLTLVGIGGAGAGVGISLVMDFFAPHLWYLIGASVLAGIGVITYRLGWWELSTFGIAKAVKKEKAIAVADRAAADTPRGLGKELEKAGLKIN